MRPLGINLLKCAFSSTHFSYYNSKGRQPKRRSRRRQNKPGNKKDTQRQTIDTQHQKLKTHETHGPRTHGYLIVFTN